NMVHMNVKSRIANALLKLQGNFGLDGYGNINCSLTKQDIASFAGTTYETLFKTLHELAEEKIIETSGKNIRILRHQQLTDLINLSQNKIPAATSHQDLQSMG
ncbi:MAG TPA: helix-turn-helix domain-containing protein, partial [Puia sp.]|nr:helix-turn-helix domain-containing protein [Puia sp.]